MLCRLDAIFLSRITQPWKVTFAPICQNYVGKNTPLWLCPEDEMYSFWIAHQYLLSQQHDWVTFTKVSKHLHHFWCSFCTRFWEWQDFQSDQISGNLRFGFLAEKSCKYAKLDPFDSPTCFCRMKFVKHLHIMALVIQVMSAKWKEDSQMESVLQDMESAVSVRYIFISQVTY